MCTWKEVNFDYFIIICFIIVEIETAIVFFFLFVCLELENSTLQMSAKRSRETLHTVTGYTHTRTHHS